ncbi:hypothetical protein CCHR01_16105 [Colletotrichum chrysophilum]|uniref:Uncharacterized protein n=1 Tax=Colletotrichum chrysophilum TaxID=1836956 RepID=A0AAD9A4Q9_9PEZI|nr:hypothetical protein CCHR01_16105 [Colletotrichum chrysophilum]
MYLRVASEEHDIRPRAYRRRNVTAWNFVTDGTVIIFPTIILGLLIAVWRLDGSETHPGSLEAWQNAITVLGTLFPILFASIVGRLMSASARWKLEKGEKLGCLEQLMGSRSVGATIQTLFQLSELPMIQAVVEEPLSYIATLYTTLVTMPEAIKLSTMDLWGNTKIPILHEEATEDWAVVPNNPGEVQYSSLVGIPIKYDNAGNVTFPIESSHIHLECSNNTRFHGGVVGSKPLNSGKMQPEALAEAAQLFASQNALVGPLRNAQLWSHVASGSSDRNAVFEPNITTSENATTFVEEYVVLKQWMGLCVLSSVVLIIAGAVSLVFTHLTYGPEILGYVSTAIRNSEIIKVPRDTDWLDGPDLTKEMAETRVRYGFMHPAVDGAQVVGIGVEENMELMKNFLARDGAAK